MADTSADRQNVEIDEKEVPQQLDYQQDGGKVSMAAPMDKAEQRLVWKLDLLIMPITFILYLLAYLDRSNLGNAKLQGLESTLMPNDESGNQFALLSAINSLNFDCKAIRKCLYRPDAIRTNTSQQPPNIVIGIVTIAWGAASSLQAVAFNYAGVTTARYFLGLFEAGFGPVIPFYYSLFYLKSEHGFRTSFFISAAPLAGAFGGLIAYGVQHIHSHIATWRILLFAYHPRWYTRTFVTTIRPETTKWLTEDERKLAQRRLNREVASEGRSINWKHVIMSFTDYKAWMICLMYQSLNVALSSISVFLPTIVKTLGYTNAKAQLMTAVLVLSAIGYTILLAVPTTATKARYGAIFLAVSGTYSGIPLAMAVLGSYIYPSREGPAYTRGFAICCGFAWWGAFLALVLSLLLHLENRRRDRREGKPSQGETPNTAINADKAEGFRYVL
ncbi:mfs general substrate transporter [Rhizoctonia solani]|uniref:Mfs general substrate transporter n=1 Tax=Rhizoctonia solani TaxID=456999 RepID=A0A8H7M5W3_9AGAM|nr:mfs general substrate transporter [Rhizoctonia solani]